MFVPIDALKPILADLVKTGQRAGPARPWLGVAADEVQGRLVVSRVSPEGPGDKAGIQAGDIILGVGGDGVRTQAEFYRKVWGRGGAGTDIPLRVLQGIDVREITVHSIDRVEYFRPAHDVLIRSRPRRARRQACRRPRRMRAFRPAPDSGGRRTARRPSSPCSSTPSRSSSARSCCSSSSR